MTYHCEKDQYFFENKLDLMHCYRLVGRYKHEITVTKCPKVAIEKYFVMYSTGNTYEKLNYRR